MKDTTQAYYEYLFQKGERLTAAVYLLTGYLSDSEPLKWSLRDKHLTLHATLHALYQTHSPLPDSDLSHLLLLVSDIKSMIALASDARMISRMNAEVLLNEYADLESRVAERGDASLFASHALPTDFFRPTLSSGEAAPPRLMSESDSESLLSERIIPGLGASLKDIRKRAEDSSTTSTNSTNNSTSQTKSSESSTKNSTVGEKSQSSTNANEKSDTSETKNKKTKRASQKIKRRDAIVSFIKDNDEVSVSDIAEVVTSVSEKTIQRELNALIKKGIIRKEGERRWSRYFYDGNGE